MRINRGFLVMMEKIQETKKSQREKKNEGRKNQKIKNKKNLEKETKAGSRSEA